MLGPLREMTDFLSTQSSATSATTRPALTSLLIRIICITPIWILLTLPPFYIITTRRVVLSVGTIILTYHSSPARVFRVLLWRSLTVRRICVFLTGLNFSTDKAADKVADKSKTAQPKNHATAIATSSKGEGGVRFTFIVYENQRRWLGIGWTYSLFPNERAAWTDEHLNSVPSKDNFELPDANGGNAIWRWVEGSQWRIEGGDNTSDGGGWIYYDNKVSQPVSFLLASISLILYSGKTVDEGTAGDDILGVESGTEMPSLSKFMKMETFPKKQPKSRMTLPVSSQPLQQILKEACESVDGSITPKI